MGRALRYVRSEWTLEVLLSYVPERDFARWAVGLDPFVDDAGWLQIRSSRGLQIGSGGGLNPVITFLRPDAAVSLITGTTCSPANDAETLTTRPSGGVDLLAGKREPTTGIQISADGEPEVVRSLVTGISVG